MHMRAKHTWKLLLVATIMGCTAQQVGNPDWEVAGYTNQLISEPSTLTQRHAHDPVNWNVWEPGLFEMARDMGRPILLCITFSAQEKSRQMQERCYQDTVAADLMNRFFLPVLVDREAFPEVEAHYERYMDWQIRDRDWPIHVIVSPEGAPVYAGGYMSPDNWKSLLRTYGRAFENGEPALPIIEPISSSSSPFLFPAEQSLLVRETFSEMRRRLDTRFGGYLEGPKYPEFTLCQFLFEYDHFYRQPIARDFAKYTLSIMAEGGIYDQLGGGFFRKSRDARWHIPFFEKMLYDQALMIQAYSWAYQLDPRSDYEQVVYETLAMADVFFRQSNSGYLTSIAAYSEGQEGRYYMWPQVEIDGLLGGKSEMLSAYFNFSIPGNWAKGQNVPYRTRPDEEWAAGYGMSLAEFKEEITVGKEKILAGRTRRLLPDQDTKELTAWNGLMASALATAYRVFGEDLFLQRALELGDFLRLDCQYENGEYCRYVMEGEKYDAGRLEDYAFVLRAYLDLYQMSLEPRWLDLASSVCSQLIPLFYDAQNGRMKFTAEEVLPKSRATDLALRSPFLPDPYASIALSLRDLYAYSGYKEGNYIIISEAMLAYAMPAMQEDPFVHLDWMRLLMHRQSAEYALVMEEGVEVTALKDLFAPGLRLTDNRIEAYADKASGSHLCNADTSIEIHSLEELQHWLEPETR